jgi:hypothetical protein
MGSSTSGDGNKVVEFPQQEIAPEERARRLRVEVDRLARLPLVEWLFYLEGIAEKHSVPRADLKAMVEATVRANEKKAREDKAEDQQRERRVGKEQIKARREEERARREQERADKEAARKQKEKDRAFEALVKLPSVEHEARLAELAKRLDEDPEILRDEFAVFVGTEDSIRDTGHVEPWDEPADTQALLMELVAQIRRYVVMHDDVAIAVSLWVMFAWIHEIAVHSPNLIVTSAEPDSGKSTLLGVLSFLVPRPYSAVELTGANIYHIVDRLHPTLLIDEADQLFRRKPALTEVVNTGWTRGTRIPRVVRGDLHQFDPFCPKIMGMKNLSLPDTTASRGIVVKFWPKLLDERITDFTFTDDADFVTLRRKLARWSADNAARLKESRPTLPAGFGNRLAANWRLLFAIADLAGGTFPKQARAAAIKLSRKRHRPSEGLRLLTALSPMLVNREVITSAEVVRQLNADKDGEWCEFRGRGPITQRQVAALLEQYDIFPDTVHPTKRPTESPRGYRCAELKAVIARLLPHDPHIRTFKPKKP